MTIAHDFSSQFNRPDLHSRMAPRRRLPKPTSATTTSTTLQNGVEQPPQPILTYSQFLGAFEEEPPTMIGVFHPPGLSYPTTDNFAFDAFASLEPGPSRARGSPPSDLQSPRVIVESGWSTDVFGRQQWVGHGRIEDVDDDAVGDSNLGDDDEDNFATPRAKSIGLASTHPGGHEVNGFHEEDIPLISTPPPCPRPKKLPSLRETTTGSEYHSLKSPSTITATAAMDVPANAGTSSPAMLDDPNEVSLVKENLDLLISSQEDVKFMNTFFLAKSVEHDLSQHIDICSRLEESLESLRRTLTLRTQIGAEEWHVRSSSWHQKYSRRLLSLRTTLQRLARMRQLIETQAAQPFRPRQRLAILTKLEQHEAKLADLASKYSTAFDRLRLRHLHFLLTQSHNEAKRQQKARLMSRASFDRLWKEGKTLRAVLRHQFHDLRQEFYNNSQRSGRNASAP
ncbi:hypothetical protein BDZ97DRAFT_984171 [Flammula alnicola]|nr:hypothetical protein BDZ97DRAFT_984171 [Flammula alnicola]